MIRRILIFVFLIAFFACNNQVSRLELVLMNAGNNEAELRKVLEYYSGNDSNSLKLKAAVFLIENLPGHLSADSAKVSKIVYDSVNSLLDVRFQMKNNKDSIEAYVKSLSYSDSLLVRDIDAVKADFLIKNIEDAFAAWNKPWARHLTFSEFCEYLLPYKYTEFQRLDSWRDSLAARFGNALEDVYENDETYGYAYTIGDKLNARFLQTFRPVVILRSNKLGPIGPFFNSGSVHRISFGDCNDYAVINVAMMKSMGVPAAFEYVPIWGEKASGQHGWSTVINNYGPIPIPHTDKDVGEVFFPTRRLPKIYRYQYAAIPEREQYMINSKHRYNSFAQFEKDVTSEYIKTSDLEIPIDTKSLKDRYVHISVSNLREWSVVDFGVVKNKKAIFRNMGRDIVYLIQGYDGAKLVPVSAPFILHYNGDIRSLQPDTLSLETVELWRKYPKGDNTAKMESRMIGGRIQAANDSLFVKDSITLYEIKDLRYPDLIPIALDSAAAYRYWRYLGVPGSYANIAELQFFKEGADSLLRGNIFGAPGTNHAGAFDGDWLTYYVSTNKTAPAWIAMDFGEPVAVTKVRCVPRSDDNGIHTGDIYELNYFVDGGWKPIKQQTAEEKYLIFDSVPRNSLLLLKNISRGQEERIFTYENGKQVWW